MKYTYAFNASYASPCDKVTAYMATPKKEKGFDVAKLQAMVTPLTVRVEKVKGNGRHPVEIPGKDGAPPGAGLDIEDILKLETFIGTEWTGGGSYEASVTDANGNTMLWAFQLDPRTYPERAIPGGPQTPPAQMPQAYPGGFGVNPLPLPGLTPPPVAAPAYRPITGNGNGGTSWPPASGAGYLQTPVAQPAPGPWTFGPVPAITPLPSSDAERARSVEGQLRAMELQLKEREYQSALDRQAAQNDKSITEMREELRRMSEASKKPDESPELKLLRDELDRQKQAAMEAKFQSLQEAILKLAEAPKRDSGADEIRALKEEMARRDAERERQLQAERQERDRQLQAERAERERERAEARHKEEMLAIQQQIRDLASANKGPDPVIEFMKENTRLQLEAARESARTQNEQFQRLSGMMMNPIEVMRLVNDQNKGSDTVMMNMTNAFGGVLNVYRQAMETIAQVTQPASNTTTELVQQVLGQAGEVANQYFDTKKTEAVAASKIRTAEAKVREAAIGAQAYAQAPSAPAPVQPVAEPVAHEPVTTSTGPTAPAAVVGSNLDDETIIRRTPEQEAVFFGDPRIVAAIDNLRKGAIEGKLQPAEAAVAILQGVAAVSGAKITSPAFELFNDGKFLECVTGLLPDMPRVYRDKVVESLLAEIEKMEADADIDDDSDDE